MLGGLCLVRHHSSTFEYLFCSGLVRSSLSALFLFFPGLFLVVVSPPPVFVLSCFRCVRCWLLFFFRFRFIVSFGFGLLGFCLFASGRFWPLVGFLSLCFLRNALLDESHLEGCSCIIALLVTLK